ncbi:MAG: hypothetical protein ACYDD1_05425 [Caulobacteraceae bacterium]
MTCDHCTGSHDLLDDPLLGPCVCCTPKAMRELEAELADAELELQLLQDIKDAADERDDAWEILARWMSARGIPTTSVRYDDPNMDALVGALRP